MDSPLWIYLIGFSAQALYFFRVIIQWFQSEKAHAVVSPPSYWVLSITASMILFLYGWLRQDISIIAGEFFTYYIYMWNLYELGLYHKPRRRVLAVVQALLPVVVLCALLSDIPRFIETFRPSEAMPLALMIFGLLSQLVYKFRFVYQLIYGIRHKVSKLPLMFWVIAVVGALMIIVYGLIRHDWVLVIGQFGIVASIRNVVLALSSAGRTSAEDQAVVPTDATDEASDTLSQTSAGDEKTDR